MNAVCIVNPFARRARRWPGDQRAEEHLRSLGVREASVIHTRSAGDAEFAARDAVAGGADLVIACGGDGTLNEVLNGVAGSDAALGFVPLGTTNIWRIETGLPRDPLEALATAVQGRRVRVDLGKVNSRYFLLMCGIGFDAYVTAALSTGLKKRLGFFAYVVEAVRDFWRYEDTELSLQVDGQERRLRFLQLIAGNTEVYGGYLRPTRGARLHDGEIALRLYAGHGTPAKFKALGAMFRDGIRPSRAPESVQRVVVGRPGLWIQVDGEPAGQTPAEISVVRDALTVVVPQGPLPHLLDGERPPATAP